MNDYLLFIDTEASGLPKNWDQPYDAANNWPYCVQIAWVIYSHDGRKITEKNYYIKNEDFTIAGSAFVIHGIDRDFLNKNGEIRRVVLKLLCDDIKNYRPLIVGHFMQFDRHMLGADFFREGIEDPLSNAPLFCTMIGSAHLIRNPSDKFLRLEQLYQTLFNAILKNHHNALVDASATADCFFEMMKRREIDEQVILQQQKTLDDKNGMTRKVGCLVPLLVVMLLTVLIYYV